MKIGLTGGIACGKSLLSSFLRELGAETLDADDVVHELIPAEERRRLAAQVFRDPVARKALEARIHPLVKARIRAWLEAPEAARSLRIAVIPLLFECKWEREFDIICCVTSARERQVSRMMTTRGYTREEAENRLKAQLPVAEKAEKSHYVIANDGSAESLRQAACGFMEWLKRERQKHGR